MKNRKLIEKSALNTIYMVMLKRISKGYTAEELSFLIGCKSEYVAAVEMMQVKGYTPKEMERIAKALDERDLNWFYGQEQTGEEMDAIMELIVEDGLLIHQCKVLRGAEWETFFVLNELLTGPQDKEDMVDVYYDIAKEAIKLLVKSGFFHYKRTNQNIFKRINRFLSAGTLPPFYIEQALNELTGEGEHTLLRTVPETDQENKLEEC